MRKPSADPTAFREALEWFRQRVPVTDEQLEQITEAERTRAFRVAGAANLQLVTDVWNALDRAVERGETLQDFKAAVAESLTRAWGRDNPGRLETIFRTNVQTAYSRGRWAQMTDPVVLQARPFWRFDAVMDSRTTPTCSHLEGTVLAADDGFWKSHQPPLHFNCRSALETLTERQAQHEGISSRPPPVAPMSGFGSVEEDWQPTREQYPAELWGIYEQQQRARKRAGSGR